MKRLLLCASLLLAGAAQPAPEARIGAAAAREPVVATGTDSGAPWRIEIPAGWNGGLVVFYHGYEVVGEPRRVPMPRGRGSDVFLSRGYAVAASLYSRQGWAVAEALAETRRLRERFAAAYGRPTRTFAVGNSMGGHLALAAVEREPDAYDGALSLCGVNMAASTLFDVALEAVEAFDLLYPGVLRMGRRGLEDPASPAIAEQQAIEAAIRADPARAAPIAARLGIRTEHLGGAVWLYHAALREIVARTGGIPRDTRRVRYAGYGDDGDFNRRVRRYSGHPRAIAYVRANATLTGEIADPVVLLSNVYDDIVPARFNHIYPALVARSGRTELLTVLPPEGSGHCRFDGEQIGRAFDTLVRAAGARR